jgi:hypothetical protein
MNTPPADLKGDKLIAWYQVENKRLAEMAAKASAPRALKLKVSEKGAVSVYGLNAQFPVTLYAEQWERLDGFMPEIKAFIGANRNNGLKFKQAA